MDGYRRVFAWLDKDGNGSISVTDLASLMRSLGVSLTDCSVQDVINDVDVDGNGSIEWPEFLRMMVRRMKPTEMEEELRVAFQWFDRDKDGFLNAKELQMITSALGEKLNDVEMTEFIRESDVDGDGMISFQEFLHMMAGQ